MLAVISILLMFYEVGKQVALMGLADGLLYFFALGGRGVHRKVASQTTFAVCALTLPVVAVYLGASATTAYWLPLWNDSARHQVSEVLLWLTIVAVLEYPSHVTINALIGGGEARSAGRFQVVSSVLALLAIVGPIGLGGDPVDLVKALAFYALLRAAMGGYLLSTKLAKDGEVKTNITLRDQFDFSVPLGFQALTGRVSKFVDRFVVAILLTEGASASLNVAAQEIPLLKPITFGMGAALIPTLVEMRIAGDKRGVLRYFRMATSKVGLAVVPVTLFAGLMAHELIPAVVGERYADATTAFRVFCLATTLRGINYGTVLQSYAETRYGLWLTLLGTASNVAVTFPMTHAFGIAGAAVGTLISTILTLGLALRRIRQLTGTGWRDVFPWLDYSRNIIVSSVSALPLFGIEWLLVHETSLPVANRAAIYVAVYAIVYFAAATASGTITLSDRKHLRLLVLSR